MLIKHSFYPLFMLFFSSFDLLHAQQSISDSVRYFKKNMDQYGVIEYIHELPIGPDTSLPREIFPSEAFKETIEFRKRCLDFYQTMVMIQEPSTFSPAYFNYSKNRMKAKQKKSFILDADIRVPIALGGKKWYNSRRFMKGVMTTLHIQPQFKVRILSNDAKQGDESLPVRTPSYIPGVNFYFSNANKWSFVSKSTGYVKFRLFHHSNGQDGDPYPVGGDGYFNTYNGDFGDNLVAELGYGRIYKHKYDKKVKPFQWGKQMKDRFYTAFWYVGYEAHPLISESIKRYHFYGRNRINANGFWLSGQTSRNVLREETGEIYATEPYLPRETWRVSANLSWILDPNLQHGTSMQQEKTGILDASRRLNLSLTFHTRIAGTGHAAGFVQLSYFGSDPYNAYFQQSIGQIRVGISNSFFLYAPNTQ